MLRGISSGLARQVQDKVETLLNIYHRYAGALAAFYESGGVDLTGRVPAKLEKFIALNSDAASAWAPSSAASQPASQDWIWKGPESGDSKESKDVPGTPGLSVKDLVCFPACFLLSRNRSRRPLQPRALAQGGARQGKWP